MQAAKLCAYTVPCMPDYKNMGPEDFIVYCARVSNPGNQGNLETAPNLLRSLVRRQHWSPLEMVSATIDIKTTRDIARQILRHRSFSFQEFSQRYGHVTSFAPGRELRWQDQSNRQSSIELNAEDESQRFLAEEWKRLQEVALSACREAYEWALRQGGAKEVARAVLPEGLTASRMYMTGSVRSWFHYVALRTHKSTQKEHREIAEACCAELATKFPILFKELRPTWDEESNIATA